ncbi:nitroreductase family protein [Desulforhopalus singaporensis]|uniref:Nitroreductase n=1 Tax=Desulforhopalus singaporensis TaxID=91360 RepID=A0A1H0TBA6_9BACT|nr:nitroreductase family protein [Desulforhopalus singaporensis]SDP51091.1 Nitroreductase [Desulforhopalus singaporensis]
MLSINPELCNKDSLCVDECPASIITMTEDTGLPEIKDEARDCCIHCGHCVAVCPRGALDHETVSLKNCPPIAKEKVIDSEQAVQFLRSRRSVRKFKNRPVAPDVIENLIQVAAYAPSGSNMQPVEWAVFSDRHQLRELSELTVDWMRHLVRESPENTPPYMPRLIKGWENGQDSVLRDAPVVIVAMADKSARIGQIDTTISLTYLDLVAPAFGLGTCWAGILQGAMLNWPAVKQAMGISEDYPFHYPLMVGYNKHRYYRLPERKPPVITWK